MNRISGEPIEKVFYFLDGNGNPTDRGVADEMLDVSDAITPELERLGVIRKGISRLMTEEEQ